MSFNEEVFFKFKYLVNFTQFNSKAFKKKFSRNFVLSSSENFQKNLKIKTFELLIFLEKVKILATIF